MTMSNTFKIICIHSYEIDGIEVNKGEMGNHCVGRPIPRNWRKATVEDVKQYYDKKFNTHSNNK